MKSIRYKAKLPLAAGDRVVTAVPLMTSGDGEVYTCGVLVFTELGKVYQLNRDYGKVEHAFELSIPWGSEPI